MLCSHDEGRNHTLSYKHISLFILLGVKASVGVKETETGERRLPHWHITSSIDHTKLCYLQGLRLHFRREILTRSSPVGGGHLPHLRPRSTICRLDWALQAGFDILRFTLSRGYLYISFCNTRSFPINHVTTSAYFRRYVLCSKSVIGG